MKTRLTIGVLVGLFAIGTVVSFCRARTHEPIDKAASASDPLNAAYMIEGQAIHLIDGLSETEAAPGSAAKVRVSVFNPPIYGNIDGEGGADAALMLTRDLGGSGSFYYVAVALNINGSYHGTRAILLGDRVAPQHVMIQNGVIIANYADRRPGEPLTARPSVGKSKYLFLAEDVLTETDPVNEGETVLQGWVTIGHEVRSFIPCSGENSLWLLGNSPALPRIMAAYRKALPAPLPYTRLFMTLAGKIGGPASDGFGVDYDASFFATQLVCAFPQGNCKSDVNSLEIPVSFPGNN